MTPAVSTRLFAGLACGCAQVMTTVCGSDTVTSVISAAWPGAMEP
jgi:hypothetical protein